MSKSRGAATRPPTSAPSAAPAPLPSAPVSTSSSMPRSATRAGSRRLPWSIGMRFRAGGSCKRHRSRATTQTMMARIEAPIVANQTLAAVSAIFSWGVREEIVAANPCKLVQRNPTRSRERVLSESGLPLFWRTFDCVSCVGAAMSPKPKFYQLPALTLSKMKGEQSSFALSSRRPRHVCRRVVVQHQLRFLGWAAGIWGMVAVS